MTPHIDSPAVCDSVFLGNSKTEAGAPGGPLAGRIGSPKPVEDALSLSFGHPHSPVPHRYSQRFLVGVDVGDNRATLAVIDGIAHEVQHDTPDPPLVHFGFPIAATHFDQ